MATEQALPSQDGTFQVAPLHFCLAISKAA